MTEPAFRIANPDAKPPEQFILPARVDARAKILTPTGKPLSGGPDVPVGPEAAKQPDPFHFRNPNGRVPNHPPAEPGPCEFVAEKAGWDEGDPVWVPGYLVTTVCACWFDMPTLEGKPQPPRLEWAYRMASPYYPETVRSDSLIRRPTMGAPNG